MIAETVQDLQALEARMLRWMAALGVLGTVAICVTGRMPMGLAFAAGAALGMLNFRWLWETGRVLMAAKTARVPRKTAVLIVARYPLALAGLAALYFSHWLPLLPVVFGLLVPGGGVLLESLFLIGAGLRHKQAAQS